ncbi:MAG: esterase-like activity of phytase family protein [Candidatus Methylumidiphilus sp.]
MANRIIFPVLIATILAAPAAQAAPILLAVGSLTNPTDLSTATAGPLESGVAGNTLGGIGSGLAWAGGNTFLALPDRGPNATPYNSLVDNTTSYITRFQTVSLNLSANPAGSTLPFTLTPTLNATTLLSSPTPLTYGDGSLGTGTGIGLGGVQGSLTLGSGVPALNATDNTQYFAGRSDNFDPAQNSGYPANARLDPEGIRLAKHGDSVFISDEYGPYVYQFDRTSGERIRTYTLPSGVGLNDNFDVTKLSSQGSAEISDNTSGRVANKGMEGLAITPDGKTLVGMMQSPLIQDGGDGGRVQRIVTIDVATGATHEYAYDNQTNGKNYNISEIVALNDHQFLVDERDGKGLGDGSVAVLKQFFQIDLTGATDVSGISGETNLLPFAVNKQLFLDFKTLLNANGITSNLIPAKIEGLAFGLDVDYQGQVLHTLYVANDNDFLSTAIPNGSTSPVANPNMFYVVGFKDSDLPIAGTFQAQVIPLPGTAWLLVSGLLGWIGVAKKRSAL